jgi:anti-sigma regulatory factor (Ser/Thr protein kinase)
MSDDPTPGVDLGRRTTERVLRLRERVPALPDCATMLRRTLGAWLRELGVVADLVDSVVLATYEAMVNVVTHAYQGRPGALELLAEVANDVLTVTVTDHGRWKPPAAEPSPGGGRGLTLIRGLADEASIVSTERGTTVRMTWSSLAGARDQ